MSDNDSLVGGLILAGLVIAAGAGLYVVCKKFGCFEKGEEVTEEELINGADEVQKEDEEDIEDYGLCDRCGNPADGICTWCDLPACKKCAYTDSEGKIMTHHNCND